MIDGTDLTQLLRKWTRWRGRRARDQKEVVGIASFVVLLQIATDGGPMGVACFSSRPVADRLALGADFAEALILAEQSDEISPTMHRVLDLLRRSEVDGEPLAVPLEMLLLDLRRQRENALDEAAQRLTVSLLFPLVLFILPAFVVLAVVPLVVAALSGLAI